MKGVEKEGAETAGPSSRHCLPPATCQALLSALLSALETDSWGGCTREAVEDGQDLSGSILRCRRGELILEESEQEKAPSEG